MTEHQTAIISEWKTLNSIVPYAGGKSRVADFLVNMFPAHKLYVDMFCGMLSVSLAKPQAISESEWFNDKYDVLVNFFIVIRDLPDEFLSFFRDGYIFDSERMYHMHVARLKQPIEIPDVEAAVAFWMTQKQTFTGRNAARSTSYKYEAARYTGRHYLDLPYGRIQAFHDRLSGVQVFNRDFRHIYEMIGRRYDNESTFVFQDPPYWGVAGGNDYYEQFSWQDHSDLADLNAAAKNRWLLTINNHPDIIGLYEGRPGIIIRPYDITYTCGTVHEPGTYVKDTKELLISNYDTESIMGPLFNFGGSQ